MNDTYDEVKLTAYALGELEGDERRAVEAQLADSEEARAFVGEMKELGDVLHEELSREEGPRLDAARRAAVLDQGARAPALSLRWAAMAASVIAFAACCLGPWVYQGRRATADDAGRDEVAAIEAEMPAAAPAVGNGPPVAEVGEDGPSAGPARFLDIESASPVADEPSAGTAAPAPPVSFEDWRQITKDGAVTGLPDDETLGRLRVFRDGALASGRGATLLTVIDGQDLERSKVLRPNLGALLHAASGAPKGDADGVATIERIRREYEEVAEAKIVDPEPFRLRVDLLDEIEAPRNTESYDAIVENDFIRPLDEPLSTFSIDVDTASYANVRRMLRSGRRPPPGAVRIEEMVNYFGYADAPPEDGDPFAVHAEVATCPWNLDHRLVRIALKAQAVSRDERPPANLVFLIDVSGSMKSHDKLPLLKESLKLLVQELDERDRVAMVVYAGASGLVLPSTTGDQQGVILTALERLQSGGSTNGAAGIELAYQVAQENLVPGGVNRVVLATDGDFNVGITDRSRLVAMIEEKAKSKVFLSVLGFGTGNIKDSQLEALADKGNGNYAYIDGLTEGRKVLVEEMSSTLITVAKDVKIQVEFNPAVVGSYRLIGYENRMLAKQDFNDDTKDAGEIGAGHSVVALYEIVPANGMPAPPAVDALKYQRPLVLTGASHSGELGTVKLRFKQPEGDTSVLREFPVTDRGLHYAESSVDFKLAAAVAGFGMILRGSAHKGRATLDGVHELALEAAVDDERGLRRELVELIARAKQIVR